MSAVLQHLYNPLAAVTQENVQALFTGADALDISHVIERCCTFLADMPLTAKDVLPWLAFTEGQAALVAFQHRCQNVLISYLMAESISPNAVRDSSLSQGLYGTVITEAFEAQVKITKQYIHVMDIVMQDASLSAKGDQCTVAQGHGSNKPSLNQKEYARSRRHLLLTGMKAALGQMVQQQGGQDLLEVLMPRDV